MKILFAASECAPFIKTGGLADVVSALPKALAPLGADVRTLLPAYGALGALVASGTEVLRLEDMRIIAAEAQGQKLMLVDHPRLFDRPGNPYVGPNGRDWPDNHLRYAALGQAAAAICRVGADGWVPDILHAHDWQAGLGPAYLRLGPACPVKVVTSIHNIAFQGNFPAEIMPALRLPERAFSIDGLEYHGQVSYLKAGLVYADKITTVSPTYARELLTPEFGMGFEGLLAARRPDLSGILNGVDLTAWDPETDPALAANFSLRSIRRRKQNRQAIIDRFGLTIAPDAPLFCFVSRLTWQKGVDLLLDALPRLIGHGAGLVVLGSGDAELEAGFVGAAYRMSGHVGVEIGYDEDLSHLIQGGADCIVIPSRFEPCGLTQLYGLRYGSVPLVARTGGLSDTIIDANDAALSARVATGFQFSANRAEALGDAIERVIECFGNRALWNTLIRRGMNHPVGWEHSAQTYLNLYRGLIESDA